MGKGATATAEFVDPFTIRKIAWALKTQNAGDVMYTLGYRGLGRRNSEKKF